jgi:prepilin-type N-terminal cleavage/methylation domain-containing protein
MPRCFDSHSSSSSGKACSAFTLLELVAVAAILGILVAFAAPSINDYLRRAAEAKCTSNLRSLNIALRGYLQDSDNVWPQGPSPAHEQPWGEFWRSTLKPYGISPQDCLCPTIEAAYRKAGIPEDVRPKLHYIPTMFSDEAGIAYRWPTQPWLIERSDAHGKGPLICFPDGSVKSASRIVSELGAP